MDYRIIGIIQTDSFNGQSIACIADQAGRPPQRALRISTAMGEGIPVP
jgi:hypothetical protein